VDSATGLVYIPIGNPDDSYNGVDRPGNNYYANSIIALDASTGELKWFYQFTHHDINDLDAPAAPSLIDIRRNGKVIPALVRCQSQALRLFSTVALGSRSSATKNGRYRKAMFPASIVRAHSRFH
jgi:quinoprotein glucose dehydrogenase